ncbi:hypothetical protein B0H67DRAFT_642606 [Lasiosphaeris hirsuta]|uniref:Cellobiose dehydrogenase-like cytochrome domain-containing protein n=1 Tax=Lasiosphaeris hirsuta TaxID=260670 RepID=A0AA40ANS1_9PEZI|nr:hypothetical protein B0H67DRAFT_642606 [Lasiosphaeris hirsuta]
MAFTTLLALLLLTLGASASPAALDKRQTTSRYCSSTTSLCYLQITPRAASIPTFRIAVPDGASVPFDTVLEIIAPVAVNWAGFAWGGSMSLNPLTVAWPNGNKATVSSRWSTARTMPGTYSSATYKTLSTSRNATHWSVEVACTGCSKWSGGQLSTSSINTFAWALSRTAVQQPSSASSSFSIHNNVGMFSSELKDAKNPAAAFSSYIKTATG